MMFRFTRVNSADRFQMRELGGMVTGMSNVFERFVAHQLEDQEVDAYVDSLLKEQEEKGHWNVLPDWNAPADIRVGFIYEPTYLACAFLMAYRVRNPERANQKKGFDDCLRKGMKAATERKFKGEFGREINCFDAVDLFLRAGLQSFMCAHEGFCPEFFTLVQNVLTDFRFKIACERLLEDVNETEAKFVDNRGETASYRGGCQGRDFSSAMKKRFLSFLTETACTGGLLCEETPVFVYGTLKKGCGNHEVYLDDALYVGEASVSGYSLYHLGAYPGMKRNQKGFVRGEVYLVSRSCLARLDRLEGEGSLYDRVLVEMHANACDPMLGQTYVYRGQVSTSQLVKAWPDQKKDMISSRANRNVTIEKEKAKMNTKMNTYSGNNSGSGDIWYACYGSNLKYARFMNYVKDLSDTTPPKESRPFIIQHRLYFGGTSSIWDNGAAAFLHPDKSEATQTYGRIYRITEEQYQEVLQAEGAKYIYRMQLGEVDGLPVYTFTSPIVYQQGSPSDSYVDTIRDGLKEIWPELGARKIEKYLEDRLGNGNAWMERFESEEIMRSGVLRVIRSAPHAIAVAEIHKSLGGTVRRQNEAISQLVADGWIRADRRFNHGLTDLETRYFVEKERRSEADGLLMGAGIKI